MTTQTTNGSRNGSRTGARRQQAGREPPHSIEAEESTLGAALLAEHATQWVLGNLRADDFYRPAHRTIYDAMAQLDRDGAPVDATSVVEALRVQGQLADVGGAPFVHTLVAAVPTASSVGYYGRVVRQAARLRAFIDLGTRIAQLGYEIPADPDRALAEAQLLLDELARDGEQIGLRPADLLEAIRERQRAKAAGKHASWGIVKLDELCDGLAPGSLVLLAALTSTGKSSLAIQVAAHNADRLHVLYVTYEMTPADTGKHTFAAISGHSLDDGATFLDSPSLEVARRLHNALDLTVYDHQPDAARLLHEVRSLHARKPLGLVVVDYVQKVPPTPTPGRPRTRNEEVGEVSALLNTMALRCDVPVLACAQLNRGAVGRRPGLHDLRDSGCLTEDTTLLRADTGTPITLRQLLDGGWNDVLVWSLDERLRLVAAPITNAFASGVKQVYRLTLASGRTIKASGNHRFLTYGGWVRLDSLQVGDRIAVPRRLPIPVGVGLGWSVHQLGLLAHLIGDGCVLQKQPVHYTSQDEANLAFVEAAAAAEFGIEPRRVPQDNWQHTYLPAPFRPARGRRNPIVQWFHDLGIANRRSYEKRLPDMLCAASNTEIATFLRHLWATDGRVAESPRLGGGPALWYSSTSRDLIDGVALLLARLDLHARIRRSCKGDYRPSWTLHVHGSEQIRRFCIDVGVHGARGARVAAVVQEMAGKTANPNVDLLPREVWGLVRAEMRRTGVTTRALASRLGLAYNGHAPYRNAPSRARLMRIADALGSDVLRSPLCQPPVRQFELLNH